MRSQFDGPKHRGGNSGHDTNYPPTRHGDLSPGRAHCIGRRALGRAAECAALFPRAQWNTRWIRARLRGCPPHSHHIRFRVDLPRGDHRDLSILAG